MRISVRSYKVFEMTVEEAARFKIAVDEALNKGSKSNTPRAETEVSQGQYVEIRIVPQTLPLKTEAHMREDERANARNNSSR